MKNTTMEGGDVVELTVLHLAQALHGKLGLIEQFIGQGYPELRADIMFQVHVAVRELHERHGDHESALFALRVCEVLFGDADPPGTFWATPLGADIAWAVGYPHMQVPQWAAAAVLNTGRVAIYTAVRQGRLSLTPESLREFLRGSLRWQRWAAELVPDERTLGVSRDA